jgi:hypothetical protein
MTIRRSLQVGTPFGTTANRPANPAVGQTYYNGTLGYLEIYTASGWTAAAKAIPFGNTAARPANPVIGEPYFNGQEARLELYTSNGWQNIVQETPSVVSIVGQLNETTTSTITINGTNFASGAIAYVVGTNGVETPANTTSLVSVVEITAVFPALDVADAPYDVKVVNTSNLYGVLYETLGVNDKPVWSTTAGSLGTFTELDAVSVTVAATDATDSTNSALQYSLVSGTLPTGLSLNSTTGVISGTPANVVSSTTYSFTLGASDSRNTVQNRAFSITIDDRSPVWTTSSVLPVFTRNLAYSTTVAATEDDSGEVTYSLFSGSLPTGLTLSSAGVISGTPTSSTNASFTIRATVTSSGTTANRAFTMANSGPTWSTSSINSAVMSIPYSFQLSATDDSGSAVTYSIASGALPSGISLSSVGLISGTASSASSSNINFRATDANGTSVDRSLSFAVIVPPTGGSLYHTPGTYNWVAPANVYRVSVVAIGAGAGGATTPEVAGGGGALGWKNNISVTPGQSYSVVVGAGGVNLPGGESYFINSGTVRGGGGVQGGVATYTGDGGGNGGLGQTGGGGIEPGGGGAGGYSGAGGQGGSNSNGTSPGSGSGGGGGGGGSGDLRGGGGGGVGVYGQGPSGGAGSNGSTYGSGGSGGSGGGNGTSPSSDVDIYGGEYGGGSFGRFGNGGTAYGAKGAVRIVWGDNRTFPSTNVTQNYGSVAETII